MSQSKIVQEVSSYDLMKKFKKKLINRQAKYDELKADYTKRVNFINRILSSTLIDSHKLDFIHLMVATIPKKRMQHPSVYQAATIAVNNSNS